MYARSERKRGEERGFGRIACLISEGDLEVDQSGNVVFSLVMQ